MSRLAVAWPLPLGCDLRLGLGTQASPLPHPTGPRVTDSYIYMSAIPRFADAASGLLEVSHNLRLTELKVVLYAFPMRDADWAVSIPCMSRMAFTYDGSREMLCQDKSRALGARGESGKIQVGTLCRFGFDIRDCETVSLLLSRWQRGKI